MLVNVGNLVAEVLNRRVRRIDTLLPLCCCDVSAVMLPYRTYVSAVSNFTVGNLGRHVAEIWIGRISYHSAVIT
jgi:hypothetical protein